MFTFIILQVVVFSAVIYFLKKILYGDTESAIKRLGIVYEDLVKKQKDLTEKLDAAEKDLQAKKEEAAAVADKLSAKALEDARKKEDEMLKKARSEAEEILAKSHASRDQFMHELEIEANKKMINFVADILKNAIDRQTRELIQAQFVKNFIEQAKRSDLASVDSAGKTFVIRSAVPLGKDEKDGILRVLSEKMGSTDLKIEEALDEKLIAGVVLQIGTLILDGSYATAIREAADQAKEKLKAT